MTTEEMWRKRNWTLQRTSQGCIQSNDDQHMWGSELTFKPVQ